MRTFADGERIFMEQSRKFSRDACAALARAAGMAVRRCWTTADRWHLLLELVVREAADDEE